MEDLKLKKILATCTAIFFLSALVLGYLFYKTYAKLDEANVVLHAREDKIQTFNKKLGLAESNLRRQDDLIDKYNSEVSSMGKEFLSLKKKYKLYLRARDQTIASLKGQIGGGSTTVIVDGGQPDQSGTPQVISYEWQESLKRFKLTDPNIFEKDNETFNYKQHFKIKGFVFSDKTGNVQVRKVDLKEVVPVTKSDGSVEYSDVSGSDMELVSSEFEYSNQSEREKSLLDMITLKPLATLDVIALPTGKPLLPGVGLELINVGHLIDYANLGLYGKIALDVSDPLKGSLESSRVGVGVNYWVAPPILNTNFSLGVSASIPLNNFGELMITMDLIVYLTGDLDPLRTLK